MAIIKQGGSNPYAGKVMTSMGYRGPRAPLCEVCGGRKDDQIYTINGNGQVSCADCAPASEQALLKGSCDPEACACGEGQDDPDPAAA